MPHMGPAAEASMLDKVVAIASDPVLHKRVLGEFKERQKAAQDAEANAREAEGKAEAAVKKVERAEVRLEKANIERCAYIAEHDQRQADQSAAIDKRDLAMTARRLALAEAEQKVAVDRTELTAWRERLAIQSEALVADGTELTESAAALEVEREAIQAREDKFTNRMREIKTDLGL